MMGPQYLHRLLFPSRYFLLCHIMCRRPTGCTRCCSQYCAIRRWRAMSALSTRIIVPLHVNTVIIAITGTPTFRRTEKHPGKPGAQTPLPFLRGVWVPRLCFHRDRSESASRCCLHRASESKEARARRLARDKLVQTTVGWLPLAKLV